MRTWRLLVGIGVGALSIGTTGCTYASYTWGEPKVVSSQTLSVETRPEFASGLTFDKATIDGTTLRVQATRACTTMRDTVTENVLEREDLRKWGNHPDSNNPEINIGQHRHATAGPLGVLGLIGYAVVPTSLSLFGLGVHGLRKGSNCRTEAIGEEYGRASPEFVDSNAFACGETATALTITGAAMFTAFLVSLPIVYSAAFGTEPPKRIARSSTNSAAAGACTSKVAGGSVLFAALGDRVVELGKTDAQGKLEVKLDQFIDAKALLAGGARWTLKLAVGGATETPIEVKTDAFFAAMDDAVWKATDEPTCAKQKTREACTNVTRYANLYPAGKHAREAAALNVAVVPVLEGVKP